MSDPVKVSAAQVRWMRMRSQLLRPDIPGSPRDAASVVGAVCGLQAQEWPAAVLGVRVRSTGLAAADVESARLKERSVVRTWAMRGTLHVLAADDVRWLLALLGPVFIAGGRRRSLQLGLDEQTSSAGLRTIRELLLDQGPQTRAEITQALQRSSLPGEGQAPYHLIHRAALEGWLCQGPDRDGEPTYVLLDDWLGHGEANPSREAALAEIARRYLAAYGPAAPEDLASWSGLTLRESRQAWAALESELAESEWDGARAWLLRERLDWLQETPPDEPVVRLLPKFDTYLLGYAGREFAVAEEHARLIHPGGGVLHAALLVDGRVLGRWSTRRRKKGLEVKVEAFTRLPDGVMAGIEAEVDDLGRFLGEEVAVITFDDSNK